MATAGNKGTKSLETKVKQLAARVKKTEERATRLEAYARLNYDWARAVKSWAEKVNKKLWGRKGGPGTADEPPAAPKWPPPKGGNG